MILTCHLRFGERHGFVQISLDRMLRCPHVLHTPLHGVPPKRDKLLLAAWSSNRCNSDRKAIEARSMTVTLLADGSSKWLVSLSWEEFRSTRPNFQGLRGDSNRKMNFRLILKGRNPERKQLACRGIRIFQQHKSSQWILFVDHLNKRV